MLEAETLYVSVGRQSLHPQNLFSAIVLAAQLLKVSKHMIVHGGSALELHLFITLQNSLRPNISNLMKRELCCVAE